MRLGFKALKGFQAETKLALNDMGKIGDDLGLMEALVYQVLKCGAEYHSEKVPTRKQVEQWLDEDFKIIMHVMEAVKPEMDKLFGANEDPATEGNPEGLESSPKA